MELRQDVDDIGEADTDKARLQQMVINLLSNAIKFPDSGSVTVSASQADGELVIAVSDNRQGHPRRRAADHLRRIPSGRRIGEQRAEGNGTRAVDYGEVRGTAGRDHRRGERVEQRQHVYGPDTVGISRTDVT